MEIEKSTNENDSVVLALRGRLDTNTAAELEKAIGECFAEEKNSFVVDMAQLNYVSSAGLRILLGTHKRCASVGGDLIIRNVNDNVAEVFDITGFSSILNLE
jgi:anti-sigma B factor antagonist